MNSSHGHKFSHVPVGSNDNGVKLKERRSYVYTFEVVTCDINLPSPLDDSICFQLSHLEYRSRSTTVNLKRSTDGSVCQNYKEKCDMHFLHILKFALHTKTQIHFILITTNADFHSIFLDHACSPPLLRVCRHFEF